MCAPPLLAQALAHGDDGPDAAHGQEPEAVHEPELRAKAEAHLQHLRGGTEVLREFSMHLRVFEVVLTFGDKPTDFKSAPRPCTVDATVPLQPSMPADERHRIFGCFRWFSHSRKSRQTSSLHLVHVLLTPLCPCSPMACPRGTSGTVMDPMVTPAASQLPATYSSREGYVAGMAMA